MNLSEKNKLSLYVIGLLMILPAITGTLLVFFQFIK